MGEAVKIVANMSTKTVDVYGKKDFSCRL